jgi:hypothetical protein
VREFVSMEVKPTPGPTGSARRARTKWRPWDARLGDSDHTSARMAEACWGKKKTLTSGTPRFSETSTVARPRDRAVAPQIRATVYACVWPESPTRQRNAAWQREWLTGKRSGPWGGEKRGWWAGARENSAHAQGFYSFSLFLFNLYCRLYILRNSLILILLYNLVQRPFSLTKDL